mmetsp:Transcript_38743/g.120514  ORF Transcript_38743/g.120514 Transcript_38743/m.120514 type:complete len:207 (+) Transcript_38743:134-754(+)
MTSTQTDERALTRHAKHPSGRARTHAACRRQTSREPHPSEDHGLRRHAGRGWLLGLLPGLRRHAPSRLRRLRRCPARARRCRCRRRPPADEVPERRSGPAGLTHRDLRICLGEDDSHAVDDVLSRAQTADERGRRISPRAAASQVGMQTLIHLVARHHQTVDVPTTHVEPRRQPWHGSHDLGHFTLHALSLCCGVQLERRALTHAH